MVLVKTTVLNVLTGIYPPTSGEVIFQEENIARTISHKITQKGIVRTFQNIRIFSNLSVFRKYYYCLSLSHSL